MQYIKFKVLSKMYFKHLPKTSVRYRLRQWLIVHTKLFKRLETACDRLYDFNSWTIAQADKSYLLYILYQLAK